MRGKDAQNEHRELVQGITPAYAGKSCILPLYFQAVEGSPPPMRGKVHTSSASASSFRITPAYAGKSLSFRSCSGKRKDHPRLCGEK